MVRHPKSSRTRAKAQTALKREASKAKELSLQLALAAYQEALTSRKRPGLRRGRSRPMLMQRYSTGNHNKSKDTMKIWLLIMKNAPPLQPMVSQRNSGQRNPLTKPEAGRQINRNDSHPFLHLLPYLLQALTTHYPCRSHCRPGS